MSFQDQIIETLETFDWPAALDVLERTHREDVKREVRKARRQLLSDILAADLRRGDILKLEGIAYIAALKEEADA